MEAREKFTCPICHHTEYEQRRPLKKWAENLFLLFLCFTSIFGTLGVYSFIHSRFMFDKESVFGIGGFGSAFLEITAGHSNSTWLREIALNFSQGCDDDSCRARAIYERIIPYYPEYGPGYFLTEGQRTWIPLNAQDLQFRYEDSEDYNLTRHWETKKGDCDTLAYLYLKLLESIGIDGNLQCGNDHCWAVVKLNDRTIIADLSKLEYIQKQKWFGMVEQEK